MKFAYEQEDGSVAIVIPAPKTQLERSLGPMTDEAYEAFIRNRLLPASAKSVIKLPKDWQAISDRAQRNKWRIVNGEIVISD